MKTANEWCNQGNGYASVQISWIEEIQKDAELDGWKRGMTEAGSICKNHTNNACNAGFASQFDCEQAILSKRDEKGGE